MSSIVHGNAPRTPQLEDFISILVTPLELGLERREKKTARTISTTNGPNLLSIDVIAARRIEGIAGDRQIKKRMAR